MAVQFRVDSRWDHHFANLLAQQFQLPDDRQIGER